MGEQPRAHVGDEAAVTWRDPKKYVWPLALLVPALPFLGFAVWRLTGGAAWSWWIPGVLVFGVIPVVDLLIGDDRDNPPEEIARRLHLLRGVGPPWTGDRRDGRSGVHPRHRQRHRHQHRPRAGAQA
ncbi:hypothetical protein [Micromonospora sp. KC723]|uniref:hypothetical protein n=1 Tax=Micromonospora sp. KC723 TaxID=2530381 RepID=UPI00352FECBD